MTKRSKGKTSKADFELFVEEAKGFLELFGLLDWQVEFEHRDLDSRANCRFSVQGRQAYITLGKDWTKHDTVSPERLRRSAFHEVYELLLADYYFAATDNEIGGEAKAQRLERTTHALIRRMENVILPLLPARK